MCGMPIEIGQLVESKPRKRGRKFYHAKCYDDAHIDVEDIEDE